MNQTVDTCSLWGGRVSVPYVWGGTVQPTPTCESCGATPLPYGPVIQMKPKWTGVDSGPFACG